MEMDPAARLRLEREQRRLLDDFVASPQPPNVDTILATKVGLLCVFVPTLELSVCPLPIQPMPSANIRTPNPPLL